MKQDLKAVEWFCMKAGIRPPPWPDSEQHQDPPPPPPPPSRILSPYARRQAEPEDIYTDSKYEG